MWRARRSLADAMAVQLTRNPTALANAVRTLDASDVEVSGGWPVHFLFPVWVSVSEQRPEATSAASANLARMRLQTEPRLHRLAALGASTDLAGGVRLWSRIRDPKAWKELGSVIGLAILVTAGLALLLAVTVLSASVILIGLWYVLRWLPGVRTLS
jgi:hypothetical protein